jgi:hypothetical protein
MVAPQADRNCSSSTDGESIPFQRPPSVRHPADQSAGSSSRPCASDIPAHGRCPPGHDPKHGNGIPPHGGNNHLLRRTWHDTDTTPARAMKNPTARPFRTREYWTRDRPLGIMPFPRSTAIAFPSLRADSVYNPGQGLLQKRAARNPFIPAATTSRPRATSRPGNPAWRRPSGNSTRSWGSPRTPCGHWNPRPRP